jgi:2-polyprenyl-3-methyl-5-hydroxy-6-metoxy-1,4-benzoquinol methylase
MGIVAKSEDTLLLSAIRELAEYRKQDPIATAFNVGNSFYLVNEAWRARDPKTSAEIMEHYRRCEMQVEQQVFATYGIPGEIALRERICSMVGPAATVLDFGAGIGSQLVPLLEKGCTCTHVDVGGVMMDYAGWRYRQILPARGPTGGHTDIWSMNGVTMIPLRDDYMERGVYHLRGKQFDVVICTEVIEHVTEPEKLVAMLAGFLRPGGLLVATVSFDDGDGMVPMHLNVDKYTDESFAAEVFPRNGLVRVEDCVYRRA